MKTFIHIGLHKTGTKYFQNFIFPKLDIVYNPDKLVQYAVDYLKADDVDKPYVFKKFSKEQERIENLHSDGTLVISREMFSGNLFKAYEDWDVSISLIHLLFPNAKIIVFFRYQTDWLLSCYRECIHEHHYQTVNKFLKDLNYTNLNYTNLLKSTYKYYNKEDVFIFFFENFKDDKERVLYDIFKVIGVDKDLIGELLIEKVPNRGYSALGIKLSLIRYKLFPWSAHRPINFFGPKSIPAGNELLSCLNKEKYWNDKYFLRDNEEIRSNKYPNLTLFEKIRMIFSWRYLIKECLDKISYIDWDILKEHRPELDEYFRSVNNDFNELIKENLPLKYLSGGL